MARRDVLQEVSRFDGNLFLYAEDTDLCCRMRRKGRRIVYLAEAEVLHHEQGATRGLADPCLVPILQCNGYYAFFKKHKRVLCASLYRLGTLVGAVVRLSVLLAVSLLGRHSSATVRLATIKA